MTGVQRVLFRSDEYKPDEEVKEETLSPAKTMKTRGVKVNLYLLNMRPTYNDWLLSIE